MVRLMSRRTGPLGAGVLEAHPLEGDGVPEAVEDEGSRTVGHRRWRVEDLEDALHGAGGLLHRVQQARQLAGGPVQHDHRRDEGEEDARGARAADHLVAAIEEDGHDGEGAGDLQERLAQLVRPDVLERELQEALVEAVEAPLGVALAAEDLDDLDAREGLLEEDGQLGHLLLLALVDAVEAPADHLHHQRDERKGDEGGQGEEGFAHQHHRDQGHDGARVAHDLDEHRRRQAGQPRHVVQHPGHQLRGVRAAEEGQGHALDVHVEIAAQGRDHPLSHGGHEGPLEVAGHALHHVGADHGQGDELEHEQVAPDEDLVHGRLHQPGDGAFHGPGHDGEEAAHDQAGHVRAQVRGQPPKGPDEERHARPLRAGLNARRTPEWPPPPGRSRPRCGRPTEGGSGSRAPAPPESVARRWPRGRRVGSRRRPADETAG